VTGAGHPAVQRLQFFLSESRWDPGKLHARRLELLSDPATAPHDAAVLVDEVADLSCHARVGSPEQVNYHLRYSRAMAPCCSPSVSSSAPTAQTPVYQPGHTAVPTLVGQEIKHIGGGDLSRVLPVTVKNAFGSNATARSVFGRHRPATNSRYRFTSQWPSEYWTSQPRPQCGQDTRSCSSEHPRTTGTNAPVRVTYHS
jgi:hypothetical protein